MSEAGQVIIAACFLVIVYLLTRKYHTWKIKKTYLFIIEDLQARKALDPSSAVNLPYASSSILRFGTRDYRPVALKHLVYNNLVGLTQDKKYYLAKKDAGVLLTQLKP
jgi:hypothetical protein